MSPYITMALAEARQDDLRRYAQRALTAPAGFRQPRALTRLLSSVASRARDGVRARPRIVFRARPV